MCFCVTNYTNQIKPITHSTDLICWICYLWTDLSRLFPGFMLIDASRLPPADMSEHHMNTLPPENLIISLHEQHQRCWASWQRSHVSSMRTQLCCLFLLISTVRQRKEQLWKVIGCNHHHPTIITIIVQGHVYTHSLSGARGGRLWGGGEVKINISRVTVNDGAAAAQTTGTLSKHLRLRWKSKASLVWRRSSFSQDQPSQHVTTWHFWSSNFISCHFITAFNDQQDRRSTLWRRNKNWTKGCFKSFLCLIFTQTELEWSLFWILAGQSFHFVGDDSGDPWPLTLCHYWAP